MCGACASRSRVRLTYRKISRSGCTPNLDQCQSEATRISLRAAYLFYNLVLMSIATLGSLELTTLLAVARLKHEAYGLAIRRDLAARTGRDYSVGALYTTLQRLEDKGLLTSRYSEPLPVRGGRSRRHFKLTGAGARALREAERHAASIWAGVGKALRPRLA